MNLQEQLQKARSEINYNQAMQMIHEAQEQPFMIYSLHTNEKPGILQSELHAYGKLQDIPPQTTFNIQSVPEA